MADKIKVKITASTRVYYSQYREITPEQFAEYEAICEAEPRNIDSILTDKFDHLINPDDVCDASDLEDLEIVRVEPTP